MRLMKSILLLILFSSSAFASGHDQGGGGVVFMCKNGKSTQSYLADTFQLLHSPAKSSAAARLKKKMKELQSEEEVFTAVLASVGIADTTFANKLIDGYQALHFQPVQSLELWGDDDIYTVPAGCEKIQLAVQHFATNIVEYNENLYNRLSKVEQAFFRLHEAYVRIYHVNSQEVRTHVEKMATHSAFDTLLNRISGKDPEEFSRLLKLYKTAKAPEAQDLVGATAGLCYNAPAITKNPAFVAALIKKNGFSPVPPSGTWLLGHSDADGIHAALYQARHGATTDDYFNPSFFERETAYSKTAGAVKHNNHTQALTLENDALVSRITAGTDDQKVSGEIKFRVVDGKVIALSIIDPSPKYPFSGLASICFWFRKLK